MLKKSGPCCWGRGLFDIADTAKGQVIVLYPALGPCSQGGNYGQRCI